MMMTMPQENGSAQDAPVRRQPTDCALPNGEAQQLGPVAAVDGESTKFPVPRCYIRATAATDRVSPTPTLCRLYHQGQCRQGSSCHQLHVDRRFLERMRVELRTNPPCCGRHTATTPADWASVLQPLLATTTATACAGDGGFAQDPHPSSAAVASLLPRVYVALVHNERSDHNHMPQQQQEQVPLLSLDQLLPTIGLRDVIYRATLDNAGGAISHTSTSAERHDGQHDDDNKQGEGGRGAVAATAAGIVTISCPVARVCKSILRSQPSLCRFGDECRYVHLCRKTAAAAVERIMGLLPPPQQLAENVVCGQGEGNERLQHHNGAAPPPHLNSLLFQALPQQQQRPHHQSYPSQYLPQHHQTQQQQQGNRRGTRPPPSSDGSTAGSGSIGQGRRAFRIFRTATTDNDNAPAAAAASALCLAEPTCIAPTTVNATQNVVVGVPVVPPLLQKDHQYRNATVVPYLDDSWLLTSSGNNSSNTSTTSLHDHQQSSSVGTSIPSRTFQHQPYHHTHCCVASD